MRTIEVNNKKFAVLTTSDGAKAHVTVSDEQQNRIWELSVSLAILQDMQNEATSIGTDLAVLEEMAVKDFSRAVSEGILVVT